jgi:hypothetical protein
MVKRRAHAVHAERAIWPRRPAFPQGPVLKARVAIFVPPQTPGTNEPDWAPCPSQACRTAADLELRNELRPDRDHPHKKHDGRQRRGFFHEYLQHVRLPIQEHKKNIVPFLF